MFKKLSINNFNKEIKDNNWEIINKRILQEFQKLSKAIRKIHNQEEMYCFFDFSKDVSFFYNPDNFPSSSSEISKLKKLISIYNKNVYLLNKYNKVSQDINKKGYLYLYQQKIQKLTALFKEMLNYKNKKYDNSISFLDLLDKIDNYYNFYTEDLDLIRKIYKSQDIFISDEYHQIEKIYHLNDIEKLIILEQVYNTITNPKDDYKNYANFYIDIDLQPGRTYKTIYQDKMTKLITLLKEMLDYVKAPYDSHDDYLAYLTSKVTEYYPFYLDNFILLQATISNPHNNYITCIDTLERTYRYLSHYMENYQEKLKEYNEHLITEDDWYLGEEE